MDLTLTRTDFREDGMFGVLCDSRGNVVAVTLEHAYPSGDTFASKIPNGQYVCVRGEHKLEGHEKPFETFEITGIDGHTGILFHIGNYNEDSSGCVLLGSSYGMKLNGGKMICASRSAFINFLNYEEGCDQFTLTVE